MRPLFQAMSNAVPWFHSTAGRISVDFLCAEESIFAGVRIVARYRHPAAARGGWHRSHGIF